MFDLDANQSHDNIKFHIVDFLRSNNFKAFAEYGVKDIVRVNNKGKGYKGRLDFYANRGDMEIVGEIDQSVPRKKSIEKCFQYPNAIKIFVLRGNKIKYFCEKFH